MQTHSTTTSDKATPAPRTTPSMATETPTPRTMPLPTAMHAILQRAYGGPEVLTLGTAPRPTPGPGQVLIEVAAAGINAGDQHLLRGQPYVMRGMGFGLLRPKEPIPGWAVAGRVAALGEGVEALAIGDEVYGEVERGAWAEYVVSAATRFAPKPAGLTMEQAAALPVAASTALMGIRDIGRLQPGQHVLINGASGGVGGYAVQIAKALGAHVTAVCSARNAEQACALGADEVIDYAKEDFTRAQDRYDLLFDIVGNHSIADVRRTLKRDGTYVSCSGQLDKPWIGPLVWLGRVLLTSPFVPQRLTTFVCPSDGGLLRDLNEFHEAGKLQVPVERVWPLEETADAMRYLTEQHARGKHVLRVRASEA